MLRSIDLHRSRREFAPCPTAAVAGSINRSQSPTPMLWVVVLTRPASTHALIHGSNEGKPPRHGGASLSFRQEGGESRTATSSGREREARRREKPTPYLPSPLRRRKPSLLAAPRKALTSQVVVPSLLLPDELRNLLFRSPRNNLDPPRPPSLPSGPGEPLPIPGGASAQRRCPGTISRYSQDGVEDGTVARELPELVHWGRRRERGGSRAGVPRSGASRTRRLPLAEPLVSREGRRVLRDAVRPSRLEAGAGRGDGVSHEEAAAVQLVPDRPTQAARRVLEEAIEETAPPPTVFGALGGPFPPRVSPASVRETLGRALPVPRAGTPDRQLQGRDTRALEADGYNWGALTHGGAHFHEAGGVLQAAGGEEPDDVE